MAEEIRLKGYREFLRACDKAGKATKKEVRDSFRKVGDIVRDEAKRDLERFRHPPSQRTVSGLRTIVRQRGVSVEQIRRKTTGLRPDWGKTQMRLALVPALEAKEREVDAELEHAIDHIADIFERS